MFLCVLRKVNLRELPPVVKILPSNAGGVGLIPSRGERAKILCASRPKKQNIKQMQYYNT